MRIFVDDEKCMLRKWKDKMDVGGGRNRNIGKRVL